MHRVIVVGVDFSSGSLDALRDALETAVSEHSREVHVVHVQSLSALAYGGLPVTGVVDSAADCHRMAMLTREVLESLLAGHHSNGKPRVFVHASVGTPARDIADLASELGADLIVVGPPARGFERVFFGSVATAIAQNANCSVMMVRNHHPREHEHTREHEPNRERCAACEAVRAESARRTLWCAEHAERERYLELGPAPL
ncbi:MAG: universal stress protein [Polyangiales bacterium]